MTLVLKTNYWQDSSAKEAFKDFIFEIHKLDFSAWDAAGYWDSAYTPFSFFNGDRVVANVCVYLLDAIIDGKKTQLAQISGVGTHPDFRRQGLNRQLTDRGLEWAQGKHQGVFLFSDPEAKPYYDRCGFTAIKEYLQIVEVEPKAFTAGAKKLDPSNKTELDTIYQYAMKRDFVSDRFSVASPKLSMFHAIYPMRDNIYEIADLECLVFCKRRNNCLSVFDIIGSRIPAWSELYPYLAEPKDKTIELHFYTDKLKLKNSGLKPLLHNNPYVLDKFPTQEPVFSFSCRA